MWALLPELSKTYPKIPENENEFCSFFLKHHLSNDPIVKQASRVVAHNLAMLYQILHPERIILLSPFLMDKDVFNLVKQQFFTKTPPHTHDDARFIILPPEFRGEIYGSTYSLFKQRLQKELTVRH